MIIRDIYETYDIPFPLQQHMIRVAAVCAYICDHRHGPTIDTHQIISAALLHDLGNIVKMDFSLHTEGYGHTPEYRENKKQTIMATYGTTCDVVTKARCHELEVDECIIDIIMHMGIESYKDNPGSLETQIVRYADMRVDPRGITSLEQRMHDAKKRYGPLGRPWAEEPLWSTILEHAYIQEELLFSSVSSDPASIDESSTAQLQARLRDFVL